MKHLWRPIHIQAIAQRSRILWLERVRVYFVSDYIIPRLVAIRHIISPASDFLDPQRKRPLCVCGVCVLCTRRWIGLRHFRIEIAGECCGVVEAHRTGIIVCQARRWIYLLVDCDLKGVVLAVLTLIHNLERDVREGDLERVAYGGYLVGVLLRAGADVPVKGRHGFGPVVIVERVRWAGPGVGVGSAVRLNGGEEGYHGVRPEWEVRWCAGTSVG